MHNMNRKVINFIINDKLFGLLQTTQDSQG